MTTQTYLERDQTLALENATRNPRDRSALYASTVSPAPGSQKIIGLHLENVNFDAKLLQIVHEKAQKKAICPKCKKALGKDFQVCPRCLIPVKDMVEKTLKEVKMRTIPVDQTTLDLLREYTATATLRWDGRGHVLFDFNRKRAYQIVQEAALHAGLPDILNRETNKVHHVSPHRLRDALAVTAMKRDNSPEGAKLLQEMLGHANQNTTQHYNKVGNDDLAKWHESIIGEEK